MPTNAGNLNFNIPMKCTIKHSQLYVPDIDILKSKLRRAKSDDVKEDNKSKESCVNLHVRLWIHKQIFEKLQIFLKFD